MRSVRSCKGGSDPGLDSCCLRRKSLERKLTYTGKGRLLEGLPGSPVSLFSEPQKGQPSPQSLCWLLSGELSAPEVGAGCKGPRERLPPTPPPRRWRGRMSVVPLAPEGLILLSENHIGSPESLEIPLSL